MISADDSTTDEADDLNERAWLRILGGAFAIGLLACVVMFVVMPMRERERREGRYLAARSAVVALRAEDRSAFEALLVDDAPNDAYEAALEAVSIADMSHLSRGQVDDETAAVITAEGYEVVVPLTEDRKVVPGLFVRPAPSTVEIAFAGYNPINVRYGPRCERSLKTIDRHSWSCFTRMHLPTRGPLRVRRLTESR